MKSSVKVEELNAAVMLLTGLPLNNLAELHITPGVVTAVTAGTDGFRAVRIPIHYAGEQTTNEYTEEPAYAPEPEETSDDDTDAT